MSTAVVPRPRSAAEILDASVRLVRHHYWPLIALTALFYVPISSIQMAAFPKTMPFESAAGPAVLSSALVAWGLFTIVWYSATLTVVLTFAAADIYSGANIEVRSLLVRMLRRMPAASALTILGIGLFALGAILCAIPTLVPTSLVLRYAIGTVSRFAVFGTGLFLWAAALMSLASALLIAMPVLVLEGRDPIASLRRSASLTQGLRAHVLRVYGLVYLMYLGLYFAAGIIFRMIGYPILTRIAVIIVTVAAAPFAQVPGTMLYYDLRVRKEAYDIDVMAGALESSAAPQIA